MECDASVDFQRNRRPHHRFVGYCELYFFFRWRSCRHSNSIKSYQSIDSEIFSRFRHPTICYFGICSNIHFHHYGRKSGIVHHVKYRKYARYRTIRRLGSNGSQLNKLFSFSKNDCFEFVSIRYWHQYVFRNFGRLDINGFQPFCQFFSRRFHQQAMRWHRHW